MSATARRRRDRRALRDRHEPAREPAHRRSAARPRGPAGRSRIVALLHQPRGRPDPALRRDGADPAGASSQSRTRTPLRTRSSPARSRAPSASSRARTSRSAARSGSTPHWSTSSARSSIDGGRSCSPTRPIPAICAERCREQYEALVDQVGADAVRHAEQRIDGARARRAWAEHLALIEDVREGIHLQRYGGREPIAEFHRQIVAGFGDFMDRSARSRAASSPAPGHGRRIDCRPSGVRARRPRGRISSTTTRSRRSGLSLLATRNVGAGGGHRIHRRASYLPATGHAHCHRVRSPAVARPCLPRSRGEERRLMFATASLAARIERAECTMLMELAHAAAAGSGEGRSSSSRSPAAWRFTRRRLAGRTSWPDWASAICRRGGPRARRGGVRPGARRSRWSSHRSAIRPSRRC